MEAALMGYGVYGTDLSEKMVRYTTDNMEWLRKEYGLVKTPMLEVADAVDHIWRQPTDVIACEGYLGQPLGGQTPSPEKLQKIVGECDKVMRGFLENIHEQLEPSTRLCIAMPAWFVGDSSHHLPVISELTSLGYTRLTFTHASNNDLIYRRDDQITGRELVVLVKN
jgi:tRNA G10  N-methylase Trm11